LKAFVTDDARIMTTVCDVSDRINASLMVDDAVAALDGIDILINNAGISGPTAPLEQTDPRVVLDVNLVGTYNLTRQAIL